MAKSIKPRIVYYQDPLRDDFANNNIQTINIEEDPKFRYIHKNIFWRWGSFLVYYGFAIPLLLIYLSFFHHVRVVNKKARKFIRKNAVFLYGNHSHFSDAFMPNIKICLPRRASIIANPDAVSIKGLKNFVQMLGAIPLANTVGGTKKFLEALEVRHQEGRVILIYPEAHIWPYYTDIRPFADTSFYYPVKFNVPVVAFVTTYRKRRFDQKNTRKPKAFVTISTPFYPDMNLSRKEAQQKLRDEVYTWMKGIAQQKNNYAYIQYIQKGSTDLIGTQFPGQ